MKSKFCLYILPLALQLLIFLCCNSWTLLSVFGWSYSFAILLLLSAIYAYLLCLLLKIFICNWRLAVDILNHLEMNSQFLFSSSYSLLMISKLSINLLKQLSFPFNISFFQFNFDFVCQETGQPHLQPGLIFKFCIAFGFCVNQKVWLFWPLSDLSLHLKF